MSKYWVQAKLNPALRLRGSETNVLKASTIDTAPFNSAELPCKLNPNINQTKTINTFSYYIIFQSLN